MAASEPKPLCHPPGLDGEVPHAPLPLGRMVRHSLNLCDQSQAVKANWVLHHPCPAVQATARARAVVR